MNEPDRYPKQVFWSEEDAGFIALAADLPGCSAFGETAAEALHELSDAIRAWIAAAQAAGNPIPAPSTPVVEHRFSGKILLRMPKSLHASLAEEAEAEGVSLNQHVCILLAARHQIQSTAYCYPNVVQGAMNAPISFASSAFVVSIASNSLAWHPGRFSSLEPKLVARG